MLSSEILATFVNEGLKVKRMSQVKGVVPKVRV
jgi:hypothetical protein